MSNLSKGKFKSPLLHFTSSGIVILCNGISKIAEVPTVHLEILKKREGKTETSYKLRSANIYLVVFLCDPGGNTLAVVAAVRAAGAVSTAALHQEAAWPENGIGPFQLLAQSYRKVAWSATVQSNFIPQKIKISSSLKTCMWTLPVKLYLQRICDKLPFQMLKSLPLPFLLWMNDFPSTCQDGLYNSSISTCHRSGSRYLMTSSTVLRPSTASESSSIPWRDGGRAAASSGSDTLCEWKADGQRDGKEMSFALSCEGNRTKQNQNFPHVNS